MHVVLASLPLRGHAFPMVPLALACADTGHDVTLAVHDLPGPWPLEALAGAAPAAAQVEAVRAHRDAPAMALARAVLGERRAVEAAARLLTRLRERPHGLVVHDATDVGAGIAAELAGVPAVAFNVGHWHPVGRARALVQPLPPSFRMPDLPARVPEVPVRSVAWSPGGAVPAVLGGPRERPVVYATLGTVAYGAVAVLRAVLADLAGLDVDVLVAVGPDGDPAALGELPETVQVERLVAQDRVLAQVDLVVHHGGTGTTLGAFEHGLPQVVLPQGADQFLNARRLAEVGAGRALAEAGAGAVRDAVLALLDDAAPERAVARRLRDEMAAMPAPADVVPVLEALAGR